MGNLRLGTRFALPVSIWLVSFLLGVFLGLGSFSGGHTIRLVLAWLVAVSALTVLSVLLWTPRRGPDVDELPLAVANLLGGAVVAAIGGLALTLGVFLTSLGGWGGGLAEGLGGSGHLWQERLVLWLIFDTLVVAVVGAAAGVAAWVIHIAVPSPREPIR